MRVSEIRVKQIRVNQGLGVFLFFTYKINDLSLFYKWSYTYATWWYTYEVM